MTFLKSRLLPAFLMLFLVVFIAVPGIAQPPNPDAVDDQPVPITGLEYLLISGGILGGYKLFRNKKKEKI